MRHVLLPALFASGVMAAVLTAPTTASAQSVQSNPGLAETYGMEANAPSRFGGLDATTPSRIPSTRREMNRGRRGSDGGYPRNMTERQAHAYAERVIRDAGFVCNVVEARVAAQSGDRAPFVEVDCQEGGGLILADTWPIQATDCLDVPEGGINVGYYTGVVRCTLPGNVAVVAGYREVSDARN